MLGIKFIKFQPNIYVLEYKKGKIVKEGIGLSFFYYAPTTSLVAVPTSSIEAPFIFEEMTKDFQTISIQGQISFKVAEPKKVATFFNYTLDDTGKRYISDDAEKMPQRIINIVQVMIKKQMENLPLREAIKTTEVLANKVNIDIKKNSEIVSLGIEILGFSILSISPNKETSRALEAEAREQILKESDDAIYTRRNASVEQERTIKENELNTEIAIENKKKQIRETQMEAERSVQGKKHQLQEEAINFNIKQEERKKSLVKLSVENSKIEAEAKAYAMSSLMKAFKEVNPETIQALATVGMEPEKMIALAFQGLAQKAEKIGQLNISPDLLKELLGKTK